MGEVGTDPSGLAGGTAGCPTTKSCLGVLDTCAGSQSGLIHDNGVKTGRSGRALGHRVALVPRVLRRRWHMAGTLASGGAMSRSGWVLSRH